MNQINILDCTLRDGGRIIDCSFKDKTIKNICKDLSNSKIDIIEVGFIRNKIEYKGNSTFFTKVEQMIPFIYKSEDQNTNYVAFVDFGMFDEKTISNRTAEGIDGIRFGFTKNDYIFKKAEIKRQILSLQSKGYDIYFQDVNTSGYSDSELIELVEFANDITPPLVSFGIVDTYGSMDADDLDRIFSIINHNLNQEIALDFHSHNNMQLSFALSQEVIKLCRDSRKLIIDATLNGMGKCAGNLNTELIISHLNRKLGCCYDMDLVLDVIDEYLYDIKKNSFWGYSIPAFMAGIYKAHPNNVTYLSEKFRLRTKDIKHIIARIDEKKRQTYDYDNIQKIYIEYSSNKIDDKENMEILSKALKGKDVLVLVPGKSIQKEEQKIREYIVENNPIIISVNFEGSPFTPDYEFFGNVRRFDKVIYNKIPRIISSNIKPKTEQDIVINYFDLIECTGKYFDNSTIMLLNLLRRIGVINICIAGFDGFSKQGNDFVDDTFYELRFQKDYKEINAEMEKTLRGLVQHMNPLIKVKFLTSSIYEKIFL